MNRAKEDLLVLAAQDGDQRAFDALYRHYSGPLSRFAYRLCGNEQVALDAAQEAWITLSKSLRGLKDPRGFRLWAYKTTRWRTMDLLRKMPTTTELAAAEQLADPSAGAGEIATSDQLARHLAALPAAEKAVLTLFYLEELTVAEIAVVEEVPVGTVKSRLNRARSRLRDRLTGETK
ncbi:MAG: sigma-70 family RNA polymerase sigma factor [Alphaproteobacteria bacterium]|nr:sigma-70 family RNA polymerase sigma factor [Alphaproteobacteria bacterium]